MTQQTALFTLNYKHLSAPGFHGDLFSYHLLDPIFWGKNIYICIFICLISVQFMRSHGDSCNEEETDFRSLLKINFLLLLWATFSLPYENVSYMLCLTQEMHVI